MTAGKKIIRKIITIDESKCNGCGLCAEACHENAIAIVDGIARLMREDYCDGLGDCLPACPTGAISFEEREALAYNEAEVKKNMAKASSCCPSMSLEKQAVSEESEEKEVTGGEPLNLPSRLGQWPCQIRLVPAKAHYLQGAELLIAADCAAFAYASFHEKFMKGKITLIGCPKLDDCDYTEKLTEIFTANKVNSITVVRMEVPCCAGIVRAVRLAAEAAGIENLLEAVTISINGDIISRQYYKQK